MKTDSIDAVLSMLSERGELSLSAEELASVLRTQGPARSLAGALERGALLDRHPLAVTMLRLAMTSDPLPSNEALWEAGRAARQAAEAREAEVRRRDRDEARRHREARRRADALLRRARR